MPNMVYIIDKQGKVVYKAMWTDHTEIETVLENLVMAEGYPPTALILGESQLRRGLRPGSP